MFKKPFHVKTNTAMKNSDKRKLKSSVLQQFAEITSEQVELVLPNKAAVTAMKIQTHGEDHVVVYVVEGIPAFFESERFLYPTVYTLWKCPNLLPCFTTWPPVLEKLRGGADLMLPGVVVPPEGLPRVEKSQLCGVNLMGNLAPVAIGTAALSSSDMVASAMKGKGLLTIHSLGDHLWEAGNKSIPPQIDPKVNSQSGAEMNDESDTDRTVGGDNQAESEQRITAEDAEKNGADCGENTRTGESGDGVAEEMSSMSLDPADGAVGGSDEGAQGEEEEEEEDYGLSPADIMDQLLYQCLLHSLKKKVKPSDLPLLTSTFYRNYILPCCPEGKTLDIKKSSYKKLSKFLEAMQDRRLLEVKEAKKGVDNVTAIYKDHDDIRSFVPPDNSNESQEAAALSSEQTVGSKAPEGPPEFRTFYCVTPNVAPVLQSSGFQKGTWMTKEEVRNAVTAYVKNESLVDQGDYSRVTLDPILHDAVINKSEGSVSHLKWDQLFTRCLHKMNSGYQIVYPGLPTSSKLRIHKGQVQPIKLKVERKAGNKWITIINNLEQFNLDPKDFAHHLQISVAASTSVGESPNAKEGLRVTVQGNQIKFLEKFLTGHYKIPRRYIEGLQQAPKGKGKR
ncbi:eukaryotic translation initiation factor 2D-like [Diadema antillarum]|uniref:eukaryotic translation initiation factor 2D-like n=1 Tax=Diadema antillarum TaxID=105358 RepID=UPI003A8B53EC